VKEEMVQLQGTVVHQLKNALVVSLDSGPQIRAILSGRMQGHGIRCIAGDRVNVELSAYDLSLGRVVHRF
jgi:translation initiation factor IF-1